MATRDRTSLFLRYREESCALHGVSRNSQGRLGSKFPQGYKNEAMGADGLTSGSGLPPPIARTRAGSVGADWLRSYHDLVDDVAEIQSCLEKLTSMYAKHLLPSFGDDDQAGLERDIQIGAQELTRMLQTADAKVQRITNSQRIVEVTSNEHSAVLRNMQKRFAGQVQQLSLSFRRKQKDYMSELQGQREVIGSTRGRGANPEGLDVSVDMRDSLGWGDASDTQMLLEDDRRGLTAERNREITNIATSINDLATIVKDLAVLVVDQGTVLDRVDYNIEDVRSDTQRAVRQLKIADRYQRKKHAFWCILFLALACGFMSVLLMLKWLS
jgi:syntaxin 16